MNITSLGIGSGLQLESIVEAYINAEAIPNEIRLQEKEDRLGLELSGVGSFKSSLSTFDSILKKLAEPDAFNQQTISVSSSAVEVDTNGFASNGEFSVEVQQLAQGSRQKSTAFTASTDVVGSGTLTFAAGTNSFDVAIGATDDLSAIRDKINEQAENFGVTANIINSDAGSFLVFNSSITGAANNLTVTNSDASLDNISTNNTTEITAQDAIISIDNNTITNDSNIFKNVIEDVTITAKEENIGDPTTLTISQDKENASELIDEFVKGFNTLMDDLTGLGAPTQGRLAFDPNVRQVKQQLTNAVLESVAGLTGSLTSLGDLGLEINRDGQLQISTFSSSSLGSGQDRLNSALENNLDEVGLIFASVNGVATSMSSSINDYIDTDGVLTLRENSLNERISGIADEWSNLEDRLRSYEETLRKQFTALDSTVAQYNSTGTWLASTLANILPKKD